MLLRRFTISHRPPIFLLPNHPIINNDTSHISPGHHSCCSNSIITSLLHKQLKHHHQQFGTIPIESNSTSTSPTSTISAEEAGDEGAAKGNMAAEDEQQTTIKKNMYVPTILARDIIKLYETGPRQTLSIKLVHRNNGHRFRIGKFPNIYVPGDAYMVVQAMDALLGDLQQDKADKKSPNDAPLACRLVNGGKFYDYQLEAIWRGGQLFFRMSTIKNEATKPSKRSGLLAPIHVLPWLRQRMGEMLAEHDGSQQLGPMPPVPEWILKANLVERQQKQSEQPKQQKSASNPALKSWETNAPPKKQKKPLERSPEPSNLGQHQPKGLQSILEQIIQRIQQKSIMTTGANPTTTSATQTQQYATLLAQIQQQMTQMNAPNSTTTPVIASQGQFGEGQHANPYGSLPNFPQFYQTQPAQQFIPINLPMIPNSTIAASFGGYQFPASPLAQPPNQQPQQVQLPHQPQEYVAPSPTNQSQQPQPKASPLRELLFQFLQQNMEASNNPQGQQQSPTINKHNENHGTLAAHTVGLEESAQYKLLRIKLIQGKSGKKVFCIITLLPPDSQKDASKMDPSGMFRNIANILVPEDAYSMVNALDTLMEDLPEKHEEFAASHFFKGANHDFKIEIASIENKLALRMGSIKKSALNGQHKRHIGLFLPLWTLPWLRQRMAEMLAEHDGSQQLGPMPPVPEWILRRNCQ